ncbi:MAG: DUF2959 domain-containing protein [Planctomycetes bacterium]|nr:DUF2959 domain-containing protein [Planctomycetota bacterium]
MNKITISGLVIAVLAISGCRSAYYKTMEAFGQHKRDILVSRVEDARDAQEDAKEQFKSALEKFTDVVEFSGGKLQDKYNQLKSELDKSKSKAKDVRSNISGVENVAKALFKEWESELEQYSSDELRRSSEQKLKQTRQRYSQLITAMKRAESKIAPVLTAFNDQVLFLKHNLNAQAIASLHNELASVEADIATLIKEMEAQGIELEKVAAATEKKESNEGHEGHNH